MGGLSAAEVGQAPGWLFVLIGLSIGFIAVAFVLVATDRTASSLASGLSLGVRGMTTKEIWSRSRGWRPMLLVTGYLAALTLVVAGLLFLIRLAGGVVQANIG